MSSSLIRGFSDPVQQSQQVFRRIMKAMSEPGVIVEMPFLEAPAPLDPASYTFLLALLDPVTPLWLSAEFDREAVRQNLHFHTGVTFSEPAEQALFAIAFAKEIEDLTSFNKGSAEYPEGGSTLILQVDQFHSIDELKDHQAHPSSESHLTLRGPGIATQRELIIEGLSPALVSYLCERPDLFPCGIDLVLCCGQQLLCLPRSTQVSVSTIAMEESRQCMSQ